MTIPTPMTDRALSADEDSVAGARRTLPATAETVSELVAALNTVLDHLHIALNNANGTAQASALLDAYDAAKVALAKVSP